MEESVQPTDPHSLSSVRDLLAMPEAVLEARRRPMSERLAIALSWNAVVVELRAGLTKATATKPRQ
jgi:hypothetical protein